MSRISVSFFWIVLVFCVPHFQSVMGSELNDLRPQASGKTVGSDKWYDTLSSYVERSTSNSLGRLTLRGYKAVCEEFQEIRTELIKVDPPLDIRIELDLALERLDSTKIRDMAKFVARLERICALVGREMATGDLRGTTLDWRCEFLAIVVLHHGVRAYLPDSEWDGKKLAADREKP